MIQPFIEKFPIRDNDPLNNTRTPSRFKAFFVVFFIQSLESSLLQLQSSLLPGPTKKIFIGKFLSGPTLDVRVCLYRRNRCPSIFHVIGLIRPCQYIKSPLILKPDKGIAYAKSGNHRILVCFAACFFSWYSEIFSKFVGWIFFLRIFISQKFGNYKNNRSSKWQ